MAEGRTPRERGDDAWDIVVTPHRGWFELHLDELVRYRDLLVLLVHRDLVSTYKQTLLGPLWIILQPLLTTAMFTVIFGNIAGLSTDQLPAPVFYLAGVTAWAYFSECLTNTSTVFVTNASLFAKVYFPRLIVPLSSVVSSLVRLLVQCAVLAIMLYIYRHDPRIDPGFSAVLLLPVIVAMLAGTSLGLGLLLSALTRTYRDLRHLLQFGVQLLMYATPVIYPLSALPAEYRFWLSMNPLAPPIESFRILVTGTGSLPVAGLIWSAAFTVSSVCLGVLMFNRAEARFVDTV